jgi:hypothetical protein
MILEEKVLYNVLKQIYWKERVTAAPDSDYVKALKTIGMVNDGWNYSLTEMGRKIYSHYDDILSNQHYNNH